MKPNSLASRLFDNNDPSCDRQSQRGARYHRQIDVSEKEESIAPSDTPQVDGRKMKDKYAREIHFAFLPDRYAPLVEDDDEGRQRAKEERKNKKKQKYKRVKKNFGKAVRYSWKCLMLGLHSMAASYSTPLTTVASLVPEFHAEKDRS